MMTPPKPDDAGPDDAGADDAPPDAALARILADYRATEPNMREIGLAHHALSVAAVGFQPPWRDGAGLGVIVTPWAINAALIPGDGDPWADIPVGTESMVALPSGRYRFVLARMAQGPSFRICSLFSPCFQFADQEAAVLTAQAALAELLTAEVESAPDTPPDAPPPAPMEPAPSRRDLFFRGGKKA